MAVELRQLVDYLDAFLEVRDFPDDPGAHNGLQVENGGSVSLVVACTDACQATIDAATELEADLMLVHHGLFWGDGVAPLTEERFRRVRALLDGDIAVYSAHLPLDAHPEVGNNAELARAIGIKAAERFGEYEGRPLGFAGELEMSRAELADRLEEALGSEPHVIPGGPDRCRRVGVISGGASGYIHAAHRAGLDTFITGEGPHYTYFQAEESGLNLIYAGHYATETLGVKALAAHLAESFDVEWKFVDHPTGL